MPLTEPLAETLVIEPPFDPTAPPTEYDLPVTDIDVEELLRLSPLLPTRPPMSDGPPRVEEPWLVFMEPDVCMPETVPY